MAVILFISFKFNEASSSDWPPERNKMPGIDGEKVLERVLNVYQAISAADFFSVQEDPGVTMLGLMMRPSKRRLWRLSCLITSLKTLSDYLAHSSIVWAPSVRISGSTMGTSPFSWQIEAYLAKVWALSWMASWEGLPSPIFRTALHLANLAPLL